MSVEIRENGFAVMGSNTVKSQRYFAMIAGESNKESRSLPKNWSSENAPKRGMCDVLHKRTLRHVLIAESSCGQLLPNSVLNAAPIGIEAPALIQS